MKTGKYSAKWLILLSIALGTIMVPINSSIINVSLPSITSYFQVSISSAEWIITSYLLTLLSTVLFFGRLGDWWGHEKLYLTGLISFMLSSILCSTAPTLEFLIIFRGLQGLAAAMMISVSLGIVKEAFPKHQRGKGLGIYAVAIAAGLTLGPLIGGILDSLGSWRYIFLINIPLAILSFSLCYQILNRKPGSSTPWDTSGTLLQFLSLFFLVYGLNGLKNGIHGLSFIIIISFSAGFLVLFIINEIRISHPLINPRIFKNKTFSAFNLALLFNYMCMYMLLFIMPFYLSKVLHFESQTMGILLTVPAGMMMVLAPVSGHISDKIGPRPLAVSGSVISIFSFYLLSELTIFSNFYDVLWRMMLVGMGTALFQAPNNSAIMNLARNDQQGIVSSIVVTMRNLGMILGVTIAGIFIDWTINPQLLAQDLLFNLQAYDFILGLKMVVIFASFLSLIMALISLVGIPRKKIRQARIKVLKKIKK
ncbi:MFS transporter [Methanobacterium alkalithermotolerans]|uniref:MFS transporter n=1 Tax=Methanobacterium alkalithermotolerans TaxID=2731220 RepID=A0A8T8K4C7_9EURY|nr:MFS transporter [Methanobacterium alkalithermotolerans]QUH23324.1 MFS transporter [Methanobacterium alkalithermotolerans]RJS48884.1 MAG: MFS transporter [Methanobacterium sp.]